MELIIIVLLYLLPAFVGYLRGHRNANSIFIVNLLLGWVIIGWIIALVWAFTDNVKNKK